MESPSKSTKPATGLPAMPPATARVPNIFADLKPGSAPRRSERHDPTATAVVGRQHLSVALTAVVAPSGLQTRAPFCPDGDGEDRALVESLEQDGQQVPVLLERLADRQAGEYRILDGHRRVAALRHLGKTHVEAVVVQTGTEDADLLTLTANVRKNLAPLELAEAVSRLVERGLTHKDIGRRIGMPRQTIDDLVNLLRLSEPLREQMRAGRLGVSAAMEWIAVPPEYHTDLARLCARLFERWPGPLLLRPDGAFRGLGSASQCAAPHLGRRPAPPLRTGDQEVSTQTHCGSSPPGMLGNSRNLSRRRACRRLHRSDPDRLHRTAQSDHPALHRQSGPPLLEHRPLARRVGAPV